MWIYYCLINPVCTFVFIEYDMLGIILVHYFNCYGRDYAIHWGYFKQYKQVGKQNIECTKLII